MFKIFFKNFCGDFGMDTLKKYYLLKNILKCFMLGVKKNNLYYELNCKITEKTNKI